MGRKVSDKLRITEKDFLQQVYDLARLLGWKVYHPWSSIHSTDGYPDLTMVHEEKRRVVFAELKTGNRQPTPAQQGWLSALAPTGVEVYLWRPDEFELIAEILQGGEA